MMINELDYLVTIINQVLGENISIPSGRKRDTVDAKRIYCYLAKKHTRFSLCEIGEKLGFKAHATVMHHIRTCEELMERDPPFNKKYLAVVDAYDELEPEDLLTKVRKELMSKARNQLTKVLENAYERF